MPSETMHRASFQPSNFSNVRPNRGGGGKSSGGMMTRPVQAGDHLTGAAKSTYAVLKQHDGIKGTNCAQGYLGLIDAAQSKYEDDMRIASLQSNEERSVRGITLPSPRALAEETAKTNKAKAEAAALQWARDCMAGKVGGPAQLDETEPEPEPKPKLFGAPTHKAGSGGIAKGVGLAIDPTKMMSAAQKSGMLAPTYTSTIDEEVELFAPLETTDWKKYWPLAATAVGAIGLIFLLRRRKK